MCPSSLSDYEKITSVKAYPSAENLLSLQSFTLQQCCIACLCFQVVSTQCQNTANNAVHTALLAAPNPQNA